MNSLIGVLEKVQHFRYNSSLITGVLKKYTLDLIELLMYKK